VASGLCNVRDAFVLRVEEAGLNAAQPPQQLLVDGWLLRFAPGKARRARSVNAVCAGRLAIDEKIALCRRWYEHHRLPLLFRITPFSQPSHLDEALGARGLIAVDETRVMTAPLCGVADAAACGGLDIRAVDVATFARAVGALRQSPLDHVQSHELRLRASPLADSTVRRVVYDGDRALAAGQAVIEGGLAGLYDIVTAATERGKGLGTALSRTLLADAARAGAATAYLQVDAGNSAARTIYTKLGFVDRYAYWYRQAPDADCTPQS
jgi:ribosomal protein S18 acetylase RimI-like enzyme